MVGSGSAWIRNFWLDPDAELGKFRAGPGSRINHSGSTTLLNPLVLQHFSTEIYSSKLVVATPLPPSFYSLFGVVPSGRSCEEPLLPGLNSVYVGFQSD